jgi:hypothetical protein
MKKLKFALIVCVLLVFYACGPTQGDAIRYNDSIMNIIDSLTIEHELLLNQIDGHNIDSLKLTHKLFSERARSSLERAKKMEGFADKKDFRNAALEYYTTMNYLADNEAKQMVEIMRKDSLQIPQSDVDEINKLAASFDETYGKVYDKILAAQLKFADEWKFKLEESKK